MGKFPLFTLFIFCLILPFIFGGHGHEKSYGNNSASETSGGSKSQSNILSTNNDDDGQERRGRGRKMAESNHERSESKSRSSGSTRSSSKTSSTSRSRSRSEAKSNLREKKSNDKHSIHKREKSRKKLKSTSREKKEKMKEKASSSNILKTSNDDDKQGRRGRQMAESRRGRSADRDRSSRSRSTSSTSRSRSRSTSTSRSRSTSTSTSRSRSRNYESMSSGSSNYQSMSKTGSSSSQTTKPRSRSQSTSTSRTRSESKSNSRMEKSTSTNRHKHHERYRERNESYSRLIKKGKSRKKEHSDYGEHSNAFVTPDGKIHGVKDRQKDKFKKNVEKEHIMLLHPLIENKADAQKISTMLLEKLQKRIELMSKGKGGTELSSIILEDQGYEFKKFDAEEDDYLLHRINILYNAAAEDLEKEAEESNNIFELIVAYARVNEKFQIFVTLIDYSQKILKNYHPRDQEDNQSQYSYDYLYEQKDNQSNKKGKKVGSYRKFIHKFTRKTGNVLAWTLGIPGFIFGAGIGLIPGAVIGGAAGIYIPKIGAVFLEGLLTGFNPVKEEDLPEKDRDRGILAKLF